MCIRDSVTSVATVPAEVGSTADFVARGTGVVAGLPIAAVVLQLATKGVARFGPSATDGELVRPGSVVLTVTGPTRALLTAERTALNLLCHLSGVATLTLSLIHISEPTRLLSTSYAVFCLKKKKQKHTKKIKNAK